MKQKITQAVDVAVRKYNEVTPSKEKSDQGVANTKRLGAKERSMKLILKMKKLLALANPAHGAGFLEEVGWLSSFFDL